jgi:hypothetical protein
MFTAKFAAKSSPKMLTFGGPPVVRPAVYATVGTREIYLVVFAAPKYPLRTRNREEAAKVAAKCGRSLRTERESIRVRVTP